MKRFLTAAAALVFALCLICAPAFARNRVNSIEIYVELAPDGSGTITQTWTGSFDEGTECYIPISDSGYLTVSDLTASMDGTAYETLETWNVNASKEAKAYKCAINRVDNGYEICWGLSEYGSRTYQVTYTVDQLVRAYDEADGFNFMFVNKDMNTTPTDVNLLITYPEAELTAENSGAWAFGFEGEVRFVSEGVQVWSTSPLDSSDYVVVMFETQSGTFPGAARVDKSFEDVREEAFKGSDYDDNDLMAKMMLTVAGAGALIAGGAGVSAVVRSRKRKAAIEALCVRHSDFAGVPNGGNILVTWRLGRLFGFIKQEGSIIGALICRLMIEGCIVSTDPMQTGKQAAKVPLQMVYPPQDPYSGEARLYDLLLNACDAGGLLEPKHVKRCFRKHPETMRALLKEFEGMANQEFISGGYFSGKIKGKPENLTGNGERALAEAALIKRAIESYDPANPIFKVLTPEECCVYALLFDFKNEYLDGIRACYPNYVSSDWDHMYGWYWYSWYYRDYSYGEMHRAEQARSAGGGGSSSSGGGGGFSGGGSGGGTR